MLFIGLGWLLLLLCWAETLIVHHLEALEDADMRLASTLGSLPVFIMRLCSKGSATVC